MKRLISLISFAFFLLLGVILALLNPQVVMFDYFFKQASLPLSILMSLSFLIGLLVAGLLLSARMWSMQWQINKSTKKLKLQEAELLQLKKNLNHLEAQAELHQSTAAKLTLTNPIVSIH